MIVNKGLYQHLERAKTAVGYLTLLNTIPFICAHFHRRDLQYCIPHAVICCYTCMCVGVTHVLLVYDYRPFQDSLISCPHRTSILTFCMAV